MSFQSAEEKYSREVLAHAESIKTVDELNQQLSAAQAAIRDNLAAAETAQSKLLSSEASWRTQKDALDKEISDLRSRYDGHNYEGTTLGLIFADLKI